MKRTFLRTFLVTALVSGLWATTMHAVDTGTVAQTDQRHGTSIPVQASSLGQLALIALEAEPQRALELSRKAVQAAQRTGDPLLLHGALLVRGRVEEQLFMFSEFQGTVQEALALSRELGNPLALSSDLRNLSRSYGYTLRHDKAIEEARRALALLLPTKDHAAILEGHLFLISTLRNAGRSIEALKVAEAALNRCHATGDELGAAKVDLHVAELNLDQNRPTEALIRVLDAEVHLSERGSRTDRLRIAMTRARASALTGRRAEAAAAEALVNNLIGPNAAGSEQLQLLALRYDLAVTDQRWREAIAYQSAHKALSDSLNGEKVRMKIAGLQVLYEMDIREQDNNTLRAQNERNAETIASQQVSNRNLIVILVLALALIGALFLSVRNGRRLTGMLKLQNDTIRDQNEEIHAKNMELQRQNMRLVEALLSEEEKEMVIKEIHHRVKNNLQVVHSLLSIQGNDSKDPLVGSLFKEAQGRIRSMAMVHEHLYRSSGKEHGALRTHLSQLARTVLAAHGLNDRISVSVECDDVVFPVDTLMPLTLVVNELLTNAVKYAFIGRDQGQILIAIRRSGVGFELLFKDDGIGLGEDHYLREDTFGIQLVHMLAHQLDGTVELVKGKGATFRLSFATEQGAMRAAS